MEQQPALRYFIKNSNLHGGAKSGNLQQLAASQRFRLLNLRDKEGYAVALFRWVGG